MVVEAIAALKAKDLPDPVKAMNTWDDQAQKKKSTVPPPKINTPVSEVPSSKLKSSSPPRVVSEAEGKSAGSSITSFVGECMRLHVVG